VHDTLEERAGHVTSATNNQMELYAVIEAVRFVDPKKSIIVRTDSQYVCDAIKRQSVIKANTELWREYQAVSKGRRIKVLWVKGHAGDFHNERADQLAAIQANLAKSILHSERSNVAA
jgi:ribonuclease HI